MRLRCATRFPFCLGLTDTQDVEKIAEAALGCHDDRALFLGVISFSRGALLTTDSGIYLSSLLLPAEGIVTVEALESQVRVSVLGGAAAQAETRHTAAADLFCAAVMEQRDAADLMMPQPCWAHP